LLIDRLKRTCYNFHSRQPDYIAAWKACTGVPGQGREKTALENDVVNILVVEDNSEYFQLLDTVFTLTSAYKFSLTNVSSLESTLQALADHQYDVILADLALPDSHGFDTFAQIYFRAPDIPIVVLTVINDERLAIQAVQTGAQDYLIKGQFELNSLARAILYAIERHRKRELYRRLSLLDDLTGLYNRRGFYSIASQYLKLAERARREMLLFFADLDGLKQINDSFGHQEGDRALQTIAEVLRETFRSSDIISRVGGDEFMVLAIEASNEGIASIASRLVENIQKHNNQRPDYQLSLSFGLALYDYEDQMDLEELISHADRALYQQKSEKRRAGQEG
jgi:two-component system, cell cycle response regulator